MFTKVTAEFENYDMGENAARMIRDKSFSIQKISIKGIANPTYNQNPDFPAGLMNGTVTAIPNLTNGNIGAFVSSNDSDSTEQSLSVVLEVICDKKEEKLVTQLCSSFGGLKINRI